MRIWDINPGYLNRQSLLGEHRELHAVVSVIENSKKGYSRHPETLRWVGYGWALSRRHRILAAEMKLRDYQDRTPVRATGREGDWPDLYVDEPYRQLEILKDKYRQKEQGRIPLPKDSQQLWSQHKYSVLARDENLYRRLGPEPGSVGKERFPELVRTLTELLRGQPSAGGLRNALQHMWRHISDSSPGFKGHSDQWPLERLLREIQKRAKERKESYLLSSTALGELMAWIPDR